MSDPGKNVESSLPKAPLYPRGLLESDEIRTPCFVYDESTLRVLVDRVGFLQAVADVRVLYTLKPFSFLDALRLMAPSLAGFSASSLFEARLAREALGERGSVHLTSPGLRPDEVTEIARICDYISFNSLPQWVRHVREAGEVASCGLRINPQLSLVADSRYDPCRLHSKLGAPLEDVARALERTPDMLRGLKGIHFHTNCDATDFSDLLATAQLVDTELHHLMPSLDWINLGGGYLFDDDQNYDGLLEAVSLFQSKYGLDVFIEPGAALVREAGLIVSSVVDMFDSDGKVIAVLDTTINHMPEVFEYNFEPDVAGHSDSAPHSYILAGASCLAGDVFGEYSFDDPLAIGSRVVFENAGAYTLPKAHMFNGIDLPTVYAVTASGTLELRQDFGYSTFAERWKANAHASI